MEDGPWDRGSGQDFKIRCWVKGKRGQDDVSYEAVRDVSNSRDCGSTPIGNVTTVQTPGVQARV
jgi:hypothetical protein